MSKQFESSKIKKNKDNIEKQEMLLKHMVTKNY